jgi:hypothetical protein
MQNPSETFEVTLTRSGFRRFVVASQWRRRGGAVVILWLVFAYFLIANAEGLQPQALAALFTRWWPVATVLGLWSAWVLWLWPALLVRAQRDPRLFQPSTWTLDTEAVTVTGQDGSAVRYPYGELRRVDHFGGVVLFEWDQRRLGLVPEDGIGDADGLVARIRNRAGLPGGSDPVSAAGATAESTSVWSAAKNNLLAGFRLATFRKVGVARFSGTPDQAVLLALLVVGFELTGDYVLVPKPAEFNPFAWGYEATGLLLLLLAAYVVARRERAAGRAIPLLVLLLSMYPVFLTLSWLVEYVASHMHSALLAWAVYLILVGWMLSAWYRALLLGGVRRAASGLALLAGIALVPLWVMEEERFWYEDYGHQTDAPSVNVEDTYYRQPGLLAAALGEIRPGRPGVVDLYHIGFGSFATQDVFRREVMHVRRILDQRFDTDGRSLVLVNSRDTVREIPLASRSNLGIALKAIAARMNVEEDVLLLYLTSHGSEDRELAVDFWPLQLNTLAARDLRRALDEAGIRWRVVVISACYSGGFIDSLKGDNTLVITAAAPDRQSFGCNNKNEYTYFGEAYFKQGLARTHSFTEAFRLAGEFVAERERAEKLQPSRPMMSAGSGIVGHLRRLEQRYVAATCEPQEPGSPTPTAAACVSTPAEH